MSAAIDLARPEPVARAMAELHASLHARRSPLSDPQHTVLARRIRAALGLSDRQKTHALARLDAMPQGNALCHGDFHLDNIILTRDGPMVIDWNDATRGDPLADVARSLILIHHAHLHVTDVPRQRAVEAAAERFSEAYLSHYAAKTGADPATVRDWLPTDAAARLSEGVVVEHKALVALAALPP